MRYLFLLVIFGYFLNATGFINRVTLKEDKFKKNSNILHFLKEHHLPQYIYYDLSGNDKEIVSDILEGSQIYMLVDNKMNNIKQILIQVNEMMQLRIYRDDNDKYITDLIPISYETKIKVLRTTIEYSPYQSIIDIDPSLNDLAEEFKAVFFNTINFRRDIHKGDKLSIVYEENLRLSKRVAPPRIKSAMISTRGVNYYVFYYKDRYYTQKGKLLKKFQLLTPVKGRITSKFSLKRFHPILKKYKAHHGIDYGARKNRKVKSAWTGKVIFKGWKRGYGKTIVVRHMNNYKTLYAHLNKFSKQIHKNKFIKAGTYIGNVGKTGLSTGYHLHFGLYKNSRPINPKSFINHGQFNLRGKAFKNFNIYLDKYKYKMLNANYGITQDIHIALSGKTQ